jgi:protein-S-isoprenylcysteine O-methyltransferase Ste14
MNRWTPQSIYSAKPWILIASGAGMALGGFALSLSDGDWTVWRGLVCVVGAALAICGGAILQMRQTYRAQSKWRRERSR